MTATKMTKRLLIPALIFAMFVVFLAPGALPVQADSYTQEPTKITFGTTYKGTIDSTADRYRYDFKLTKPSRVTVSGKLTNPQSDTPVAIVELYNAADSDSELAHPLIEGNYYSYTYVLAKGSYHFVMDGSMGVYGTNTFTLKVTRKNVVSTAVRKVKSAKKRYAKVTWTKRASVNGYQVQVARNSKFTKGCKSKTITKKATGSFTFKKLAAGKRYYARVRTYTKTVDGKRVYSPWSKAKKFTVRKK